MGSDLNGQVISDYGAIYITYIHTHMNKYTHTHRIDIYILIHIHTGTHIYTNTHIQTNRHKHIHSLHIKKYTLTYTHTNT